MVDDSKKDDSEKVKYLEEVDNFRSEVRRNLDKLVISVISIFIGSLLSLGSNIDEKTIEIKIGLFVLFCLLVTNFILIILSHISVLDDSTKSFHSAINPDQVEELKNNTRKTARLNRACEIILIVTLMFTIWVCGITLKISYCGIVISILCVALVNLSIMWYSSYKK